MTSDLTASISSAVSNSTLVGESLEEAASTREKGGDIMDISGYHSEDQQDQEEEGEVGLGHGVRVAKQEIMNLTHITEDDIQFADD